ncbi:MAG: hypothetical protein C4523_08375 [Myxococcales bacterium]|nr:MAG: hypothetical protein C4523_08375 [Myxococcales bacterium]
MSGFFKTVGLLALALSAMASFQIVQAEEGDAPPPRILDPNNIPEEGGAPSNVLDPNTGANTEYPSKTPLDNEPGTGEAEEFDQPKPGEEPGVADDPNAGVYTGYPDAQIVEEPATARPIEYDTGAIQYPSDYLDPLDLAPMEPEPPQEADAPPAPPPPKVCPVAEMRSYFLIYNAWKRPKVFSGWRPYPGEVTVMTPLRDMAQPARLQSGFALAQTLFDKERKAWAADVFFPRDFPCGGAVHRVFVDDSLAQGVAVLAISPGLVLLRIGDELAYLQPPETKALPWRMVWDSGIEVEFEQGKAFPDVKTKQPGKKEPPRKEPPRRPPPKPPAPKK